MTEIVHNYNIATITSVEEIEKIRDVWEAMQTHPNSDIDHYLNLLKTRSNIIRPHIILVSENGSPVSMAVGRIEKLSIDLKFGYKKIFSPTIQSLTVVYGGLLGNQTVALSEVMFQEIMTPLKDGRVDVVRFNYLAVDSPIYPLVNTRPGFFSRDRFPTFNTHWHMQVPKSIEEFFQSRSSKHRSWLRRMERLLVKDYPGEVKYVCYHKEDELDKIFSEAEVVARKTYQRNIKVGFADNEETRRIYALLMKKGRLRSYITYIGNEPKAFWVGELYKDTFTLFSTGYDPLYKKYELGTILFLKMLEDLCTLGTVRSLDFGFGDASYKSRFGDRNQMEATINIFSNNFKGIKISMLRFLFVGSQREIRKLLERYHLIEKIKKIWRSRLKQKNKEKPAEDKKGM
ncbi:MAG: GNAT family N-acetyltransferase [Thermodesulfobacteriota bacterium]